MKTEKLYDRRFLILAIVLGVIFILNGISIRGYENGALFALQIVNWFIGAGFLILAWSERQE